MSRKTNWSRLLPRPIVIPKVVALATLDLLKSKRIEATRRMKPFTQDLAGTPASALTHLFVLV
jgi:hypothetical protein